MVTKFEINQVIDFFSKQVEAGSSHKVVETKFDAGEWQTVRACGVIRSINQDEDGPVYSVRVFPMWDSGADFECTVKEKDVYLVQGHMDVVRGFGEGLVEGSGWTFDEDSEAFDREAEACDPSRPNP